MNQKWCKQLTKNQWFFKRFLKSVNSLNAIKHNRISCFFGNEGSENQSKINEKLIQNRCSKKVDKLMQNGSQNHRKLVQKSIWSRPWATDCRIFGLLERCQKIKIFWCLSKRSKSEKNRPKERLRADTRQKTGARVVHYWEPGSPGRRLFARGTDRQRANKLVRTGERPEEGSNSSPLQMCSPRLRSLILGYHDMLLNKYDVSGVSNKYGVLSRQQI